MSQKLSFKKYSLGFLGVTIALLILMILFNLVIDPLDIYRFVKKDGGVNKIKPAISKYTRIGSLFKPNGANPKQLHSALPE